MLDDFDKLFIGSDVETNRDKVGLAVYHLDVELGEKSTTDCIKEVFEYSRVSTNSRNIPIYLGELEGVLLKEINGEYKLTPEGLEYYKEKISGPEKTFKYAEKFINIDSIPERFYPALVSDINESYANEIYDATLVLSRKLLENLLIDIFRAEFGPENNLELYYKQEERQFKSFSSLIENFDEKREELEHYYNSDTEKIVDKLDNFRKTANSSAHSIETDLDKEEINKFSSDLEFLSRLLFDIRQKLLS